ncbi:MAG TPA: LysR substrate-binding domain-containing protein [Stellaceae bacterium]|nr:LysR substrate-binding domain-containing protein [Stellaceae bacterium]
MTLEQLRIFVAVAEALHVTKAAQALHLTQSAASAAVAAIEHRYGVPLFHRIGRGIQLTEAGKVLLAEAKAVLRHAGDAQRALEELSGLKRGRLDIFASQTIANYWLPSRLNEFHRHHPQIALHVTIGNTTQVTEAMLAGQADLGFIEGEIEEPSLLRHRIEGDRLVLVVGARHPWFSRKSLKPAQLLETDWVLREPGSGTRQVFETAARRMGVEPQQLRVTLELPSNEAVRSAVEDGAGATVISELVVQASLRHGVLHAVDLQLPKRDFEILRHSQRYHSQAEIAFMAMIDRARSIKSHRPDDDATAAVRPKRSQRLQSPATAKSKRR